MFSSLQGLVGEDVAGGVPSTVELDIANPLT